MLEPGREDDRGMIDKTLLAVMSYNRNRYLENCIYSLERNMPGCRIKIYDDASNDEHTILLLEEMGKKYDVYVNEKREDAKHYLGGLYFNYNRALKHAFEAGYQYIFFIQDDMQIVRRCEQDFFEQCEKIFASDENIAQICPVFFKGDKTFDEYNREININRERGCYFSDDFFGLSDIGIISINKLADAGWKWGEFIDERENRENAARHGWFFVKIKNPIMMYTPWPETFRSGMCFFRQVFSKVTDKIIKAGFHPYKDMSGDSLKRFLERNINEFPIAENYLETYEPLRKPWEYSDSSVVVIDAILHRMKKLGLVRYAF